MEFFFLKNRVMYNKFLLVLFIASIFSTTVFGETVFYDDFSDSTLTNQLWKSENEWWPLPNIEDDGTGNMVIKDTKMMISSKSEDWIDTITEIKFRFLAENSEGMNFFMVEPRYDPDILPWRVMLLRDSTGVYLRINQDWNIKTQIKLGDTCASTFGDDWHTLEVEVIGSQITCYLDGEEIVGSKTIADDGNNPISSQGKVYFYMQQASGVVSPYLLVDHIKVTAKEHLQIAFSQNKIPADGITMATATAKWISGSKTRFKSSHIQMLDQNERIISNVTIPESGEAVFKVKGEVAGNYPLEASLDGINWMPLGSNLDLSLIPVPHPTKSKIKFQNRQEGGGYPAAGANFPQQVNVNIVDYDTNTGKKGKYKVILTKSGNCPMINISEPVILDGEGIAQFIVSSTEAGLASLAAYVIPLDDANEAIAGIEPIRLSNKVSVLYNQAINASNSCIEIIKDGLETDKEKSRVKVVLRDFSNLPIAGVKVILKSVDGKDYAISAIENPETIETPLGITDQNGIAYFQFIASESGPVTLVAKAEDLRLGQETLPAPVRIAKKIWHIFFKPIKNEVELFGVVEREFEL